MIKTTLALRRLLRQVSLPWRLIAYATGAIAFVLIVSVSIRVFGETRSAAFVALGAVLWVVVIMMQKHG